MRSVDGDRRPARRPQGGWWRAGTRAAAVGIGAAAVVALVGREAALEPAAAEGPPLTAAEVDTLIARCVAYSKRVAGRPKLTIAVVDTEGNALGVFRMAGSTGSASIALAKAGTGAYFSSDEESFTTRTAAFIIQDHFPPGVRFVPGGPLYGVEFSSYHGTDVNPIYLPPPPAPGPGASLEETCAFALELANRRVRGDLGGIGLFKDGRRVGGLGVDDGERRSQVTIPFQLDPATGCPVEPARDYRITFRNIEKGRRLERIVHAAARGFLPPTSIRATRITVDGIRLPYRRPVGLTKRRLAAPTAAAGAYEPGFPLRDAASIPSRFADLTLDPPPSAGPGARSFRGQVPLAFPIRAGTDGLLSEADVRRILWQGAQQADVTRAGIRRPIGLPMQCWISVVDTAGEVLGVFRFREDATLFSYDVAVQKARTAAFFSDDKAAWSTRAVGLFSQAFYPAGQQGAGRGLLYQLQDGITVAQITGGAAGVPGDAMMRIRNGITIFPGGVPLYRGGQVVGGVGVSGDGVDQDDIVADLASRGFGAPKPIRCDALPGGALKASLFRTLEALKPETPPADPIAAFGFEFYQARWRDARRTVQRTEIEVGPPYVKHPRHPGPVTIR